MAHMMAFTDTDTNTSAGASVPRSPRPFSVSAMIEIQKHTGTHEYVLPKTNSNPNAEMSVPGSLLVDAGVDPVISIAVCTNVVLIGGDPLELLLRRNVRSDLHRRNLDTDRSAVVLDDAVSNRHDSRVSKMIRPPMAVPPIGKILGGSLSSNSSMLRSLPSSDSQ